MVKRKRVTCDVHLTIIPNTNTTTVAAVTAVTVKGMNMIMMMTWRMVIRFVLNQE